MRLRLLRRRAVTSVPPIRVERVDSSPDASRLIPLSDYDRTVLAGPSDVRVERILSEIAARQVCAEQDSQSRRIIPFPVDTCEDEWPERSAAII